MLQAQLRPAWETLLRPFAALPKPVSTQGCDCSFCLPEDRILALLEIGPESLTATKEVRSYVQNALGTIGSPEDLSFLLPGLLRLWAEQLWEAGFNDAYREHFWYLLRRGEFLRRGLAPELSRAALDFLRSALFMRLGSETPLQRISGQGSPHHWMEDFREFASSTDGLAELWTAWWALPGPGHAAAALQFASCLIFEPANNPVFHRWTPLGGGGAPELRATSFTDLNTRFLESTLSVAYLEEALARAVVLFRDAAERRLAEAVLDGLRGDPAGVAARLGAMMSG